MNEKIFWYFDMPKHKGLAFCMTILLYVVSLFFNESILIYYICGHICSDIAISVYKSCLVNAIYKKVKEKLQEEKLPVLTHEAIDKEIIYNIVNLDIKIWMPMSAITILTYIILFSLNLIVHSIVL